MRRIEIKRWRGYFLTGLAVVLPIAISIGLLVWLFGTVARFTDLLLFFLPSTLTHSADGAGPVLWYWSLLALALACVLTVMVGRLTRHYVGRKLIQWLDQLLFQVPLLNRIYGLVKQVNEAFSSGSRGAFKQVVLIEFPREGQFSLGFVTGDQHVQIDALTGAKVVSVFVPTTPNPTSGFVVFQPEDKLRKLNVSVAEGLKFIVSLGAIPLEGVNAASGVEPPLAASNVVETPCTKALPES